VLPLILNLSESALVALPLDTPAVPVLNIILPPVAVPVELPASRCKLLPAISVPSAFAVAIFFVAPPEAFC
jgi:hypothetical protein